ncbi:MAG: prevent-host-death family protein [Prevotella sp.]|nr:prevent-host-death family protein [Prevotella sp.]
MYLCTQILKFTIMVVVTGRDYRANLAKYYGLAQKGEDVVVKARYGSWKVVPITEDDVVVNKRDLPQELRNALMEVKESMEGKKNLMTWEELVNELDD